MIDRRQEEALQAVELGEDDDVIGFNRGIDKGRRPGRQVGSEGREGDERAPVLDRHRRHRGPPQARSICGGSKRLETAR